VTINLVRAFKMEAIVMLSEKNQKIFVVDCFKYGYQKIIIGKYRMLDLYKNKIKIVFESKKFK